MMSIGGYFELEIREGKHFHQGAIKLSTARQCFEYILKARRYTKVYIPYYTCDVIIEPLMKLNVKYEYYHINSLLDPVFDKKIESSEAFLYTNYFGLKQDTVLYLSRFYPNLIVDNAQAFFAKPIEGVDTFYSARKFFGVPDGAYLYTTALLDIDFPIYNPIDNMNYLIGRITDSAEGYYKDFQESEKRMSNQEIHRMSVLSDKILSSLDYVSIIERRRFNYHLLYSALTAFNKFDFSISENQNVPLIYPFYTSKAGLRQQLILEHVYVPQYWQNVVNKIDAKCLEYSIANNMIALPIDQRYDEKTMNILIEKISNLNNHLS